VPVRLILGVDAEKRVQQAEATRASEAEKMATSHCFNGFLKMGASTAIAYGKERNQFLSC